MACCASVPVKSGSCDFSKKANHSWVINKVTSLHCSLLPLYLILNIIICYCTYILNVHYVVCICIFSVLYLGPERWPNKPGKNVRPSVRPYVHNQTQCSHKPNSGICWGRRDIHHNMTFKVIRGQGQGQEMTSVPYRNYFIPFLSVNILDILCLLSWGTSIDGQLTPLAARHCSDYYTVAWFIY